MKKLLILTAFLIAASSPIRVLHAQTVPRMVLLEEGTNWACPPCAAMNPIIEAYLDQHQDNLIHLAYHPNWPGADDPMYLNDPTDNMARVVSYYGISGVPNVTFDGGAPFLPSSWAVLDSAYQASVAKGSPVALRIDRQPVGIDSMAVTVTVIVVGDVSHYSSLRLRVAAVERAIDLKGRNGEPRFVHVMRTMIAGSLGTSVTLHKGDSLTYQLGYHIKPTYAPQRLYEIAFLQSDGTHEVLQAASTLEHVALALQTGQSAVQRMKTGGNDVSFSVQNTTPENLVFATRYLPVVGTDWNVTLNGTQSTTQALAAGAAGTLNLHVDMGTGAYASGYVVVSSTNARGDTLTTSYPVKFIAPTTRVAFVDVSQDSASSAHTVASLNSLKYGYVPLTSDELQSVSGWTSTEFSEIVLEANKWIITGADKQRVQDYLASGGHLLVTGGEIAFGLADPASAVTDQDPTFLANVLHATYVQDVAGSFLIHGMSGDVVSGPFAGSSINVNATSVDNPNQPDVITATNGGIPIFYYGSDQTALGGIRWDNGAGNTKLVYLSFGLQNLNATDRNAIMTSIMNWFTGAAGVPQTSASASDPLRNYPNPFSSVTTIDYTVPVDGAVRLELVNVAGEVVRTLLNEYEQAGSYHYDLTSHGLTKGTYFYILHTSNLTEMRAMTID